MRLRDRERSGRQLPRNVLLLVLEPSPGEELRQAIEARKASGDVSVHVVAPIAGSGVLQWLTGAEDEARVEAEELAARTAEGLDAEVETEVGDRDAVLAVEDALSTFPAEEIVLAGRTSPDIEAALRDLGLPLSHLNSGPAEAGGESSTETAGHALARGYRTETPFVLLAIVGAVALSAIALITLISFLVFWLA